MLPPGHRDGPAPGEQRVGAAGRHQPRPSLATSGPPRRRRRRATGRPRHLHGGLHDAGPRRGWGAARSPGLTSIAAQGSAPSPRVLGAAPGGAEHDAWDEIPAIAVPTLVVHGDADLLVP